MTTRTLPRPGGRSARVQAAVHLAVHELTEQHGRTALTVPLIAAHAGVTPSTIYRRWGDLADLLADVAMQRMRPETDPVDTGTAAGDLQYWAEQYLDEMSSEVGVTMMRDVLSASVDAEVPVPCQCAAFTASQLAVIVDRGRARGETLPDVDVLMDHVVAPIVYRALFGAAPPDREDVGRWVQRSLELAALPLR